MDDEDKIDPCEIGRVAYEAAAKATSCDQPWEQANKPKWNAAAMAVLALAQAKRGKTMIDEPKHPTYGTLDELLADIACDIRSGYEVRIGQQGALHWFENEYGKRRNESVPNVQIEGLADTSASKGGKA